MTAPSPAMRVVGRNFKRLLAAMSGKADMNSLRSFPVQRYATCCQYFLPRQKCVNDGMSFRTWSRLMRTWVQLCTVARISSSSIVVPSHRRSSIQKVTDCIVGRLRADFETRLERSRTTYGHAEYGCLRQLSADITNVSFRRQTNSERSQAISSATEHYYDLSTQETADSNGTYL